MKTTEAMDTEAMDIEKLFTKVLGDKVKDMDLPPECFDIMQCEIVSFNEIEKSLTTKMPILRSWLNPYATMQGGMIVAGIDNAVGPLSMLIAPMNVTRTIESKYLLPITMDLGYIYAKASLVEEKKRRLIFEVSIEDESGKVYTKARVENWILSK